MKALALLLSVALSPLAQAAAPAGTPACVTLKSKGAQTVSFHGELQQGVSGIVGNLAAIGKGGKSSKLSRTFIRMNAVGDTVTVKTDGRNADVTVQFGASTVASLRYGLNGADPVVCGISLNESIIDTDCGAGFSGNLGGGMITLWGQSGWLANADGSPILL